MKAKVQQQPQLKMDNLARKPVLTKQITLRILLYLGVFLVLLFVLVPYLWMVSGSFKTSLEIQAADVTRPDLAPRWIPRTFTLENYAKINKTVPMLDYFRNSMIISLG